MKFTKNRHLQGLYGAYRFINGPLVSIRLSEKSTLRARIFETGESRRLYPIDKSIFVSGPGFSNPSPEDLRISFKMDNFGGVNGMDWKMPDKTIESAVRVTTTRLVTFSNHDTRFSGRLDLPDSPGPHPGIILVHGSGKDPATDFYYSADFFAAHGIAALTYDKRGTGHSEGKFSMDFHLLAQDVLAAVDYLKSVPEIDAGRIGLTGYSQGGWVAPLAASMCDDVRYVIVNYGMIESPSVEALLETLTLVRKRGITSKEDLQEVEAVTKAAVKIVGSGFRDGWETFRALKTQYADAHWSKALKGSPVSLIIRLPPWLIKIIGPVVAPNGLDWDYDSGELLSRQDLPMLWLLGDSDESAPNEFTIPKLKAFKKAGKPYDLIVFERADHGMLQFEEQDNSRNFLGYAPGYFTAEVDYALKESGLPPTDRWSGKSFLYKTKY